MSDERPLYYKVKNKEVALLIEDGNDLADGLGESGDRKGETIVAHLIEQIRHYAQLFDEDTDKEASDRNVFLAVKRKIKSLEAALAKKDKALRLISISCSNWAAEAAEQNRPRTESEEEVMWIEQQAEAALSPAPDVEAMP